MDYLRIGALNPPDNGRAPWAREILTKAIEADIAPARVPVHEVVGFTANLPSHLAANIKSRAQQLGISPALLTAGLISAYQSTQVETHALTTQSGRPMIDPNLAKVRPVLHDLTEETAQALDDGKIVFAEAATGTGKGRKICYHALNAVAQGKRAVISAPVNILWKLVSDLDVFECREGARVAVLLGRPNFVSPSALEEWAEVNDCQPVLRWIQGGALPISDASRQLSTMLGIELCWLLDDAMSLSDEIPADAVMLEQDSEDDKCPAQRVYEQSRDKVDQANLVIMSHHMLALHCKYLQMKAQPILNGKIDVLIVDEAHDLETAFASIFSQTSHINGFLNKLAHSTASGKSATKEAVESLSDFIERHIGASANEGGQSTIGPLTAYPGFILRARDVIDTLDALKIKKSDRDTQRTVFKTKAVLRSALSGMSTIKMELSPVKKFPMLTVGQSNLDKAFGMLWEQTGACALISATLFTDEMHAGLMRWKLAAPKERAVFLPPVTPDWVRSPVRLHTRRVSVIPDNSHEWHQEVGLAIAEIARAAQGGVLVLNTSYSTIEALEGILGNEFGDRLISQSPSQSASACRHRYMTHPGKPIWLATGAAWRGVDLSNAALGRDDHTLSDLVIPRLPFGLNRSLTHHRRQQVAGVGVNVTEAIWAFRQGIGRLVRSDTVPTKHLWVLDARLESTKSWLSGFRAVLKGYQTVQ